MDSGTWAAAILLGLIVIGLIAHAIWWSRLPWWERME